MAVTRDSVYEIGDVLGTAGPFADDEAILVEDTLDPTNALLLGATARTSTQFGKTATVKAGESLTPALESLRSAGGGTLLLLDGVHIVNEDIEISSDITIRGVSAESTIIDFNGTASSLTHIPNIPVTPVGGTMAITQGSKTVTGTGSDFIDSTYDFEVGETFLFVGTFGDGYDTSKQWYPVASIESDTSLTLNRQYDGHSISGEAGYIGNPLKNIIIENLTLRNSTSYLIDLEESLNIKIRSCNFSEAGNYAIRLSAVSDVVVEDCTIENGSSSAFFAQASARITLRFLQIIGNDNDSISVVSVSDLQIVDCYCTGNDNNFRLSDSIRVRISDCVGINNYNAVLVSDSELVQVVNCHFLDSNNYHAYLRGSRAQFVNCYFEGSSSGIYVDDAFTRLTVMGCIFQENGTDLYVEAGADLITYVGNVSDSIVQVQSNLDDRGINAVANANSLYEELRDLVTMVNISGSTINAGEVVVFDSAVGDAYVQTTTTAGDPLVMGVAFETASSGAYPTGKIQVVTKGRVQNLKVDGTTDIAKGDLLTTSTTAGIAVKASTGQMSFAIAQEAYTTDDANGVIDALIINPREA